MSEEAVNAIVIRPSHDSFEVWSGHPDHPYPYSRDRKRGTFRDYLDAHNFAAALNANEFGEDTDGSGS